MFKMNTELLKEWVILVIDDEPDSLMVARMLLERCGAKVITATNGQEGLAMAEKHRPRFILSDLSMPVLDGWGLMREVQMSRHLNDIPIIALTAHAMSGDREKAVAAGFHNYLTKPLIPKTFINDLLQLLLDVPNIHDMLSGYLEENS